MEVIGADNKKISQWKQIRVFKLCTNY